MTMPEATPDPSGDFALVAIPLRRPKVSGFLRDWQVPARGAEVRIVAQRPSPDRRDAWLAGLAGGEADRSAGDDHHERVRRLLTTDVVSAHVATTTTDRLVPRHFLDEDDEFLERNLGGWSPLWVGPMAVVEGAPTDPLLDVAEHLVDYGPTIPSDRVDAELVGERLPDELSTDPAGLAAGATALRSARAADSTRDVVADLVAAAGGDGPLGEVVDPLLAFDELVEQLHRLELARRAAHAAGDVDGMQACHERQERLAEQLGVRMLLKGEYLLGRHRRSTVLLAEGLGVVVKQPAPEPRHHIDLAAREVDGQPENWPRPIDGGAMVTPRRALAQVVDASAVESLNEIFGRQVRFSTALGLSVEPFAEGPTLAALARRRPDALTADRYDQVLVYELACEEVGVENPDWHAANFMVTDDGLVHVDWGAARPIADDERAPEHVRARLDQVRELAWSFQDADLAARVVDLHDRATSDGDHLDGLRERARALADRT